MLVDRNSVARDIARSLLALGFAGARPLTRLGVLVLGHGVAGRVRERERGSVRTYLPSSTWQVFRGWFKQD